MGSEMCIRDRSTNANGDSTLRSGDRSSKQKINIPQLDKSDSTSARLWWRRFTQYIKMTRDIDLNEMCTDKEILPQYRERLETEIKDTFVWAIGESAITDMTKTVREREPTKLPLHRLYALFRIHFIPERNKHHTELISSVFRESRANQRRMYGSAYWMWKRNVSSRMLRQPNF